MNDVIIAAYHGGLGDSLQFSTLPEEFFKQQGRKSYVLAGSEYRNKEIYDLVWGCNPYICGVKEGKWNAGDIPEIKWGNNELNELSCIPNWENLHGLKPTNKYPKIYYEPKKIGGYEDVILVDLSSITLKHDGNEDVYPPAYRYETVLKKFLELKERFPDKRFLSVKFTNIVSYDEHNVFAMDTDGTVEVNSIFHYCDLMNSAFGMVSLYSGQMVLSAAIINQYNPDFKSFCITAKIVQETHTKQSGFLFDNVEYLIY